MEAEILTPVACHGSVCGLAWWRPGYNHSRHVGRVDSITSTHTKVGLTWHFDPEKHMCMHRCKRTWGNTSFPLVRVQENHSYASVHKTCGIPVKLPWLVSLLTWHTSTATKHAQLKKFHNATIFTHIIKPINVTPNTIINYLMRCQSPQIYHMLLSYRANILAVHQQCCWSWRKTKLVMTWPFKFKMYTFSDQIWHSFVSTYTSISIRKLNSSEAMTLNFWWSSDDIKFLFKYTVYTSTRLGYYLMCMTQ